MRREVTGEPDCEDLSREWASTNGHGGSRSERDDNTEFRYSSAKAPGAGPIRVEARKRPAWDGHGYSVFENSIYGWKPTKDGQYAEFQITNFGAKIIEENVLDDGTEESRQFVICANINGLNTNIEILAKDFRSMNWITEKLGGMAIVYPGQTEHARTAIQVLSGSISTVRAYTHTGWRFIDGQNYYLHGRGAIGRNGNRADVCVSLRDTLPHYVFPDPPGGAELQEAVHASLAILDIAPDRITFPCLASVYRAILGKTTLSIHISGASGNGKSQLAALIQQHFGAAMDADNFPASWQNTGNATATLAFHAKDAVLVVDDFVPSGSASNQQKLHGYADTLLRSQGNSTGRRRLSAEGKLNGNHPPRGLIVSTGESTPRGRSLNARMVILPFPAGVMDWAKLTQLQRCAADGMLAETAAAFIQWLAPQLKEMQEAMRQARFERRERAECLSLHMRTPENLDSLKFGLGTFLRFARETEAISNARLIELQRRADAAFERIEENEASKHKENDPALIFLRLIQTAILMGRAHLASTDGKSPDGEIPWGWHESSEESRQRQSLGARIGWVKKDLVFLSPDAAFQIASRLAQERGESLPGTLETMKRDLKERGHLEATDKKRRTITVRKTVEGQSMDVLCFTQEKFLSSTLETADTADNADNSNSQEEIGVQDTKA
jgi:hypothetical protein